MSDRLPKIRSQLQRNDRSIQKCLKQLQTFKAETDAHVQEADKVVSAADATEALEEMKPCCDRYTALVNEFYDAAFTHDADQALKDEAEQLYDKSIESSQWMAKVSKVLKDEAAVSAAADRASTQSVRADGERISDTPRPQTVMLQPEPQKPPILQANTTLEDFDNWCDSWGDYEKVAQLDSLSLPVQLARFHSFLSSEMRTELVHGVGVRNDEQTPPAQILQKVREYLRERRNIALDRVAFEERCQKDGESFDDYLIALKKIAANADLCPNCSDSRLATRVMVGIRDQDTRKKLLALKPFPSLQQVVDLSRSEECARNNVATLDGETKIKKVGHHRGQSSKQRQSRRSRSRTPPRRQKPKTDKNDDCWFCGNRRHKKREECPAFDKDCSKCGKKGHFGKMCRSESKERPSRDGDTTKRYKSVQIHTARGMKSTKAPTIKIDVYNRANSLLGSVEATPDTGAEGTVMGVGVLKRLGIHPDNLCSEGAERLTAANEQQISCIGTVKLSFRLQGRCVTDTAYVCPKLKGLLLPWYVMQSMGILPNDYPRPLKVSAVTMHDKFDARTVPKEPNESEIETVKAQLLKTYADVFDSESDLKTMDVPPMKIKLKGDVEPYAVRGARPIAYSWRDDVKKEIDWMVEKKIIAPVGEETSEWCHPLVCVPKANGKVRPCVDLTKLNPHVVRPLHPLKTPKEAVSNIPSDSKYFTTLDATKGYWQMALDMKSQHLTTFITPWGRYKFLRAPMGLVSTGDEFCRVGDKALDGIQNVQKVVDDMIAYDKTFTDHVSTVVKILESCRKHKITLNPAKFKFGQVEVEFAGYRVNRSGVTTDEAKLRAIKDFPTPTNISELRSFIGLVNQVLDFSKDTSSTLEPLRPLMSTKNQFLWTADHEKAFQETKKALVKVHTLTNFDPKLETVLQTDASRKKGLGFVLLQKHGPNWKIVQCGSRFTTDTESRYAMVELELLAIQWAANKCRIYLEGLPHFRVITDHKPLIPILNDQTLADVENSRVQRLKEKLGNFVFTAEWKKGAEHVVPDALSRAPVDQPDEEDVLAQDVINGHLRKVMSLQIAENLPEADGDPLVDWLREIAITDEDYQCLVKAIENDDWRDQTNTAYVKSFRKMRDQLGIFDGLVVFENRFVIPSTAKSAVLDKLHASHQGVVKTKRRARQTVYWPGMNSDIENKVGSCQKCQENQASLPKEPILHDNTPKWVFQNVATDLFQYGSNYYLVYTDQLSGWPMIAVFNRRAPNARDVIKVLRQCFVDLGVPVKLRSDNGPQFAAKEFKDFLKRWGVIHACSSPTYAQSNGLAESAVKAMKALVKKTTVNGNLDDDEYWQGVLEFRNTPRENEASPAEIVFGHQIRSLLPVHHRQFNAKWTEIRDKVDQKQAEVNAQKDEYYNRSAKAHQPFKIGDPVRVQDHVSKKWSHCGQVVGIGKHRDYLVKLPSGSVMWRNRRFIRYDSAYPKTSQSEREGDGGDEAKTCPKGILKSDSVQYKEKKKVRFSRDTETCDKDTRSYSKSRPRHEEEINEPRRSQRRSKRPERYSP